jgi:hypothetical protein
LALGKGRRARKHRGDGDDRHTTHGWCPWGCGRNGAEIKSMESAVAAKAKRSEPAAILIFINVTYERCALIKLLLRLLRHRNIRDGIFGAFAMSRQPLMWFGEAGDD